MAGILAGLMDDPYRHSVEAYELLHAARGKDYRREAAAVVERVRRRRPEARTVLDVACGSGLHLAAFQELGFEIEGVDVSAAMLDVARSRLPGVALHQGDMGTFRLGQRFDAVVCLFSSIGYMATLDDLAAAVVTMREHLLPGGVLVVEPWFEPDDWHDGAVFSEAATAGDLAVSRVSRSWREDDQSLIEMRYALPRHDRTWSFTELHRMGLFTTEQQLGVYRAAGLTADHEPKPGLTDRGLFVA
ncbi:MAG TPA: class I SAM-dependent methyltransferase, partial [Acidimicrobiales bacterium]|nr:class I SAM-dependent methyltransferase [Acidimicrobiales bacterium]